MRHLLIICLFLSQPLFAAGNYEDGVTAYNQARYKDAYEIWLPLAENGNGIAQYNIGVMHEHGYDVKADVNEAFDWYRLAGDTGYSKVQHALGNAYYFGKGVEKDYKKAMYWWEKAARQKVIGSQYNLGVFYLYGERTYRNIPKGQYWLQLSAKAGHVLSQKILANLEKYSKKSTSIASKKTFQPKYSKPHTTKNALNDNQTQIALSRVSKTTKIKKTTAKKPIKESVKKRSKKPTKQPIKPAKPYDWIAAQKLSNYTIQITVQPSKKAAVNFVRKHKLRGQAFIYRIGVNTHKIITGSFRGYSKASKMIQKLPNSLKKDGPWVKSFKAVHKERIR